MGQSEVTAEGPAAAAVAETLEAVVAGMGLSATVVVSAGEGESDLDVRVDGEGTSALVGRGGETIDALQYLLAQIATRAEGGARRRVRGRHHDAGTPRSSRRTTTGRVGRLKRSPPGDSGPETGRTDPGDA